MRHGVALVALIGWFAASGIGASPAAAQEEPIPDLAVTIIEAEVVPGADVVRLVAEYRNLGPVPLFGPPFLIVSADGAIVVDGLFGVGLEPGDSGREEWDVAIEDGWRGRAVGFEVVIAADNEEERGTIANNVASVAIDIPGGPIPPDGGGVPWVWPVVTIPPIVVVAGGAQALRVRRRRIRQAESRHSEPPDDCRPGERHTHRECQPDPARRQFTAVELREGWRSEGTAVKLLNAALKAQRRGDDDQLEAALDAAAATIVTDGLRTLLAADDPPRDVTVVGHVEGGSVKCKFTSRVCLGAGWEVEKTWTAKIKDRCDVPGEKLRGLSLPLPGGIERDVAVLLRVMLADAPLYPPRAPRRHRNSSGATSDAS